MSIVKQRRSDGAQKRRGRVRAVLSLGAVLGLGAVGTLAAWSDSATATTGSFSTGSGSVIKMELNGNSGAAEFNDFNVSDLMPGEGKAALLVVKNSGAAADGDGTFDYTSEVVTTGPTVLADALTLRVVRGGTVSGTTCAGGTELESFKLNPTNPQDTTGAAKTLAPQETDTLCVQVTLANPVTKAASNMFVSTKFHFTAVGQD